jgi:hypothetical protein
VGWCWVVVVRVVLVLVGSCYVALWSPPPTHRSDGNRWASLQHSCAQANNRSQPMHRTRRCRTAKSHILGQRSTQRHSWWGKCSLCGTRGTSCQRRLEIKNLQLPDMRDAVARVLIYAARVLLLQEEGSAIIPRAKTASPMRAAYLQRTDQDPCRTRCAMRSVARRTLLGGLR